MLLQPQEVERFYAIWRPLILFVNRRLQLVPEMLPLEPADPLDVNQVIKVRDAMWADDAAREAFVAENPAGLSAADLALVESWRHRRAGMFTVLRHLKKHSLFLEGKTVYAVLGLASPLDEVVPFTPCYVRTVLLPFGDRIIYDSLLVRYNIMLGPGIRKDLDHSYKDAKERGAIVTSLLPAEPASREEQEGEAQSTNAKVFDAFRTYLYRSGLSPKVVDRDLANAATFAEGLLGQPEPLSLRELSPEEVSAYVSALQSSPGLAEGRRREAVTSLKRLVKFLRDTERMDYWSAQDALDDLKGRG